MIFSFDLDLQPNGGIAENCLTTFIPNGRDSPKWFDRPCVEESDSVGDPGHKFMCECDFSDQKQNPLGDTFAQPYLQVCKYYPKGQFISKCLMVSSLSPKKRTKQFVFTTSRLVFVRFLGESEKI